MTIVAHIFKRVYVSTGKSERKVYNFQKERGRYLRIVYLDILLTINLAVDYLILFASARLAGIKFKRLKGLFGAIIGSAYSAIIFAEVSPLLFAATKLLVSALMIFATFGKRNLREFSRLLMMMYICSFLFSGFMMLINNFIKADSFFVKGGIIYYEISAIGIVVSCVAALIITEILKRIFRRGEPEGAFIARIYHNGKSTVLNGFTDTGNNLSEPLCGTPVAVANPESLKKLLPEKLFSALVKGKMSTGERTFAVPCKTVSGSVLIFAFRPERVMIINEKGEYEAEEIMIALSENVPKNFIIIGKNVVLKEKDKIFSEV